MDHSVGGWTALSRWTALSGWTTLDGPHSLVNSVVSEVENVSHEVSGKPQWRLRVQTLCFVLFLETVFLYVALAVWISFCRLSGLELRELHDSASGVLRLKSCDTTTQYSTDS